MDGVAGCFERPLHINDGGVSFTTVSSLYFSDSKAETTSNCTRPKKERMISWVMESTSHAKAGQYPQVA